MLSLFDHCGSHLKELRRRVLVSMVAIVVCSSVAYAFAEPLSEFFIAPLLRVSPELTHLVYTNLTEAFFSYMKLAVLVGITASSPILIHQAWRFVSPGLHAHEKSAVFTVVLLASLLFLAGAAFAYWIVLPRALSFLMGFARADLTPMPKFGEYLTFIARTGLAFGLAFEIPFLMAAAVKTGLVGVDHFVQKRLYFYLGLLGLAFVLAAGDPFSAILLAIPLGGLYEVGALVGRAIA